MFKIVGIELDTAFFTGNHSPRFSLQAACIDDESEALVALHNMRRDPNHPYGQIGSASSAEDLAIAESLGTDQWPDLVPFTPLQPG